MLMIGMSGLVNVHDIQDNSRVVAANLVVSLIITPADGDPKKVVIREGETVSNLVYMAGCNEVTIESGTIKAINYDYHEVEPKMDPDCGFELESTFNESITPISMVVDCSTEGDSIIRTVKFNAIVDCDATEDAAEDGEESEDTP